MARSYRHGAAAACCGLFAKRPQMTWSVQTGENMHEQRLHTSEQTLIGSDWSVRRRNSFILGRIASAAVVSRCHGLGPVLRGRLGEPRWPLGVTGSIAHKDGLALAVGMRRLQWTPSPIQEAVGVDLEFTHEQLPSDASDLFLGEDERNSLLSWQRRKRSGAEPLVPRLKLLVLFSLKEAVIKAVSQASGVVMSFRSFSLRLCDRTQTHCSAMLPASLPLMNLELDFTVRHPVIVSYCHVTPTLNTPSRKNSPLRTIHDMSLSSVEAGSY